jgi:hypothetical protein
MDDVAITQRLAVELSWKAHEPMECVLQPLTVLQLVGALQLAQRHPHFADQETVAATTERFIAAAREYFSNCPAVLDVIRRGDDPACDVVNEGRSR